MLPRRKHEQYGLYEQGRISLYVCWIWVQHVHSSFHGFIKNIPLELEEAARIDGCTMVHTFFLIVLPLLKTIMVTVAIINVMWI